MDGVKLLHTRQKEADANQLKPATVPEPECQNERANVASFKETAGVCLCVLKLI